MLGEWIIIICATMLYPFYKLDAKSDTESKENVNQLKQSVIENIMQEEVEVEH